MQKLSKYDKAIQRIKDLEDELDMLRACAPDAPIWTPSIYPKRPKPNEPFLTVPDHR